MVKMLDGVSKSHIELVGYARHLRRYLIPISVSLVGFWIFSVIYIIDHPADKGSDGFEFLAAIPFTGIAFLFSLPALLLSFWRQTVYIGALLAALAVGLNGLYCYAYLTSGGHGSEWKCITFYELCKRL